METVCPECKQGKHINCINLAWSDKDNDVARCDCYEAGHG